MEKIEFNYGSCHILQIGGGGTGSAVAADLARLIYALKDRYNISYRISDGDQVEEANILRQNFIPPDLNRNKAQVLSDRYSRAYGIPISYHDGYITDLETLAELLYPPSGYTCDIMTVMLGCVDDNGARKLMHEAFTRRYSVIWIDAGNEYSDGQVVVGVKREDRVLLPPVTVVYPDILKAGTPARSGENCAAVVVERPQAYSANKMGATIMLSFLYNILAVGSLETHMATFDSRNVMVRPWYIGEQLPKKA